MRILNIRFKNINSLEGEGRIDFDQGPIADSGVFAITGPNGSGKTSILDVITLALYGETFRFDKPAEHVMTKHTNDCYAQVEFLLAGERYLASWQAARDATVVAHMQLQRLANAEVLADTPSQVRGKVAELTGMDFHKFSKSMVLPQGDFAAFLNALDSERMDILEKISGSEMYTDFRQQTETRYQQTQSRLVQVQQDIGLVPLLSPEALQAAEHDLADFNEQVAELLQQQQQLQQQLTVLDNVTALEQKQVQLLRKRQELQAQIEHYKQDLQDIAAAQSADLLRVELQALDNKQAEQQQAQASLASLRSELNQLQQQLANSVDEHERVLDGQDLAQQKQAMDALKLKVSELKLELPRATELAQSIQQQLQEKQTGLAMAQEWLQQHQTDAVLMQNFPEIPQLRNLRTELVELSDQLKTQTGWSKKTEMALKKNQTALANAKSSLIDLNNQVSADEARLLNIAQGKSFEQLKETLLDQQQRVNDFQELNALAGVTVRMTKKGWFSWLGAKNKPVELPDISVLQTDLAALQAEMTREQNIVKVLEQAIGIEALVKKMGPDRAKLQDGKPCFLCGSLTHPYVLKPPVLNDAKKALVDQRTKIQTLKLRVENASRQLAVAEKQSTQLTAKQQRLQQIRASWTLLANRLSIMRDGMAIDNLSLQKRLLVEELDELDRIKALVKEHAQLQRNIAKTKNDIESKQVLQEKISGVLGQLEAAWHNRPPEYAENEQRLAACQAEEKVLAATLESQLKALGEKKLPSRGKEDALFDKLNSRRQDYQIYQLREKGLQDEIVDLQQKLQATQTNISNYQQQMTAGLEALQQGEWLALHLAVIEKQQLIVAQEQQLQNLNLAVEALQRSLLQQLTASGYSDLVGLRKVLALIDNAADIQQLSAENSANLLQLDTQLQQLTAELEREAAAVVSALKPDELQALLHSLSQQIDIAEQEVLGLQNKLYKQQQYRERYDSLVIQRDELLQSFNQAEAEMALIQQGQAGFRQRIQQVMVDKLLAQTNQMLEKLGGRYYVRSAPSEHGLALEIEDSKQKSVRRQPQSLSGGESFVVSLALALALADIANNGQAIDSLFLDEGFGNLDAEALYLAMSALEGLKTQGKTVGVISHVDGVKKRIKTQIELVKKPNGLSELKLVA